MNISLTMGTYTDARSPDTAEAVERLPSLPITETGSRMVAPNLGKEGQIESTADHSDGSNNEGPETTKPRKTRGLAGFSGVGDTEFESVTSTMSTSERCEQNAANHGAKQEAAERLHQWLHHIAELGERSFGSVLVDVVAETLGTDAVIELVNALEQQLIPTDNR